jgi:hypothetical protein
MNPYFLVLCVLIFLCVAFAMYLFLTGDDYDEYDYDEYYKEDDDEDEI